MKGFCGSMLAGLIVFTAVVGVKAADNRYEQWQGGDQKLEQMIQELDELLAAGRASRAAHPAFLEDLGVIVGKYRQPRRQLWFRDDFTDGELSSDPAWVVRAGDFKVDRYGALYSSVPVRRPPAGDKEPAASEGDQNLKLLFGVLQDLAGDKKAEEQPAAGREARAVIMSAADIPNSFTLHLTLRSDSNWGSTGIGLYQKDNPDTGYRLVYHPSPGPARPLQLIKYRYGKEYVVDAAGESSPGLDDGQDHQLLWNRAADGEMVVTVDGIEVLRTSDLAYRDPFAGVVITNNGGAYGYDNIEVYSEQ